MHTLHRSDEAVLEFAKEPGGPVAGDIRTDWGDIMLWAVLANEMEIAQQVWPKTREPLRMAVWAAHIAHFRSQDSSLIKTVSEEWADKSLGCMHMHTCAHAHMHTRTHAHTHICTHTHMHTCT